VNSKESEPASSQFDQLLTSLQNQEKSKNKVPSGSANRESGLWNLIRQGIQKSGRRIETTRLESWAIPGVPDVLLCAESGRFSFLELKVLRDGATKLALSPHQCAWLSRHAGAPCFVVLRDRSLAISVFDGADAVDLRMDGFAAVAPLAVFEEPYAWEGFLELTCPL
tara:strand:- start:118 stop:618 length:501 start_codon:yes stop_codon:yes gene_type:complete